MSTKGEQSDTPQDLGQPSLARRLDELIAQMENGGDAERSALLLDLRAHQFEVERQSRALRAAEQALALSRDRYARLFDLAPLGYVVFDPQGHIKEINLAAARMLGRPRATLTEAPFAALLEPGEAGAFVVRLHRAGGSRMLQMHSSPRQGEDGPECFAALVDITAEEEARRRQRQSDRLRQAVLDALPAEVAVLDAHGCIIAVNQAWRQFAEENGGSAALREGIGIDYLAAGRRLQGKDADAAGRIADRLEALLAGSLSRFVHEYPCHTPDRQRWFAVIAAPVRTKPAAAVVVHFDITARKLAEERARHATETMAQRARINAVGTLAVSLIHELTQPLSAAGFYSGTAVALLARGTDDRERLTQVLNGVDDQIKRTADILQRLREFIRRHPMHTKRARLDEIFPEALELVRWFAADREVDLEIAYPAPATAVMADPLQIAQVLVNLICNSIQAIDAAGSPHRTVAVSAAQRADEVEVTVRDTGPGLPADRFNALFDIFASSKDEGLGMGLAISREIVEAHGGKLWAEPPAPGGAVFHFTLPRARPKEPG
ncbi:MAG: ATP-binding protein [Chromatiaceae bacterium]|nr:ATP-binding protein [Chromatiaceae bacterium]